MAHLTMAEESVDLSNKARGVIGTGATAVQMITEISKDVGELYVFQLNLSTACLWETAKLTTKRKRISRRAILKFSKMQRIIRFVPPRFR